MLAQRLPYSTQPRLAIAHVRQFLREIAQRAFLLMAFSEQQNLHQPDRALVQPPDGDEQHQRYGHFEQIAFDVIYRRNVTMDGPFHQSEHR